jgi:hypothetical protein
VVAIADDIRPLPEVKGFETTMVQNGEGGRGGNITPVVVAVMEV